MTVLPVLDRGVWEFRVGHFNSETYEWSSARAHALGAEDALLSPTRPFPGPVTDWSRWLEEGLSEEDVERLRRHTRTSGPLGDASFLDPLETLRNRVLRPLKRGPKPRERGELK
jgi:putative transposase